MTSEIQYVALEELRPHPDNPRLVYREDVIDNIASQIEEADDQQVFAVSSIKMTDQEVFAVLS